MEDLTKYFFEAVENRRTYYSIGKEQIVEENKIVEIVNEAVKHAPSAFNSQSARVIVLFGEEHNKLWELVKSELQKIVPESVFEQTEKKIDNCFKSGYGTILYFEDMTSVEDLQNRFPTYKDSFPLWSYQSSGMLQYIIWTALETLGLGVSLQHYNPLIDDVVKKEWNVPAHYNLLSQMPFGKPLSGPDEKDFLPLDMRVKVFG